MSPVVVRRYVEDLDEGLGDQVVGVQATNEQPGQPGGGVDVAGEQGAVGIDVAFTDPRDELRVRWFIGDDVDVTHGWMAPLPRGRFGTA
jgi:hypothetical protein